MTIEPGREIYVSSNGDAWRLLCDLSNGHSFIRHSVNLPREGTSLRSVWRRSSLPTEAARSTKHSGE